MIHLVTFSDESMSRAADLCIGSGQRYGCNTVTRFEYGPFTGSRVFEENEGVFLQSRGLGYWAWKPVIIDWTLNNYREEYIVYPRNVKDGDFVIYADAGIEFINNVSYIIDRMAHDKPQDDVFLFSNSWEHGHWCKGDTMRAVFPDGRWEDFGKQVQASVLFFRVSDFSRAFVKEWLDLCLTPGLIDDSPSLSPNHEQFQEHRHDQSLITCLAYKYGISLHWWPAVYNRFTGPEFVYEKGEHVDTYPPLFHHHRLRDSEWLAIPQLNLA